MQIFDGKETIDLTRSGDTVQVRLLKTQYDESSLPVIQEYVLIEEAEEGLWITYQLPANAASFGETAGKRRTRLERLQLTEKLGFLVEHTGNYRIPYIHPDNLFLNGEGLHVVHSGLQTILAPTDFDAPLFLKNYKALVLFVFHQKLAYEKLLNGDRSLNDAFSKNVNRAETPAELSAFLSTELAKEREKIGSTKRLVSRGKYSFYRFVGIFALLFAIVSSGFLAYFFLNNQKQEAIITAQTSFMTNNYAQAQSDLKEYSPDELPKAARYVLAVSSIHLTDLTGTQKQTVLNNISIKSDDNTLNYWVYMGRGMFDKALDLAQNLGDDQLTLLAYTDLYQAAKLNSQMDGAKKQKLLDDYTKQIQELTEKLGK